jgi:hypothetical protein
MLVSTSLQLQKAVAPLRKKAHRVQRTEDLDVICCRTACVLNSAHDKIIIALQQLKRKPSALPPSVVLDITGVSIVLSYAHTTLVVA